ncbi:hypothetical protein L1887_46752 [Cichorium endivia]|nr:hypothetical protein L1887_46752 [Cichorium endivia]
MPWTETRPMQRLDFIRACHAGTDSFSALCRLFGISRKTGYKWLQRFDPSDLSSLSDRSRAPRSHSRTVPDDIAGQLTALRQKHPDWGPKKLRMVKSRGTLYMGKKGTVFLSEALTDEYIMLEEQDDGLEAIIFNGITLAYYDRKTQSVLRID